jgi:formylglycine-generating enzyme required for sulfatase activity
MDFSDLGIELVSIPAGTFWMGSANEIFSEAPAHLVTIPRSFQLGNCPITQRQWTIIWGDNPSEFKLSADLPVESVSWSNAVRFCTLLADKTGRLVRLPSEAEWEYACRGNATGDYFFSPAGPFPDQTSVPRSIERELVEFAWFEYNSRETSHPVGLKRANPFGLHDITGNVWEWCLDYWHSSYVGAPTDGSAWLEPPHSGSIRCLRGGAWDMNAFRCRSSYRSWDREWMTNSRIGFRICVE